MHKLELIVPCQCTRPRHYHACAYYYTMCGSASLLCKGMYDIVCMCVCNVPVVWVGGTGFITTELLQSCTTGMCVNWNGEEVQSLRESLECKLDIALLHVLPGSVSSRDHQLPLIPRSSQERIRHLLTQHIQPVSIRDIFLYGEKLV